MTQKVRQRALTLFLSHGKSLSWWKETGLLSREMLLYLHLLRTDAVSRVTIFSYDAADRAFVAEQAKSEPLYDRITILAPERGRAAGLRAWLWAMVGPIRHRSTIAAGVAIKTNQVDSSVAALTAATVTGRPLVVRLGYLLSTNYRKSGRAVGSRFAALLERIAFRKAERILVSAPAMKQQIAARQPGVAAKIVVHPTYVDIDAFNPISAYDLSAPLLWVGRLSSPKNLENLLRGCALAGRDVDLVGAGELEAPLRDLAATLPVRVRFLGKVANDALPELLRAHSIFILPSFYEGLPKALLEAMACGLVCLASDVTGLNDLIEDGANGLLIRGFEPRDIAAAIRRAEACDAGALGAQARRTVEETFSLQGHAAREATIYAALSA